MAETDNSESNLQEFLLDMFTEEDFNSARDNLLARYNSFNGLLISNDGSSILTPDDVDTFKEHAADFTEQTIFSDYELEQLKILTVLIYQLLAAGKGIGSITGQTKKIKFWNEHGHFYILRKIFYHSQTLEYDQLVQLIEHQNTIYKLYQRSKQIESEDLQSTTLQSKDNKFFIVSIKKGEFTLEKTIPFTPPKAKPKAKPKAETPENYRHIVFCDQDKDTLLETARATELQCGAKIAAASYIGVKRKANEDGIVILPDNNQVTVIDGMGGYGNGAIARQLFCDSLIKYPGEIDKAVLAVQQDYETNNIGQGGVCAMNMQIESLNDENDEFEIDLGQAGDVHIVIFDEKFELQYESIDEAIGHKVINAIMGRKVTMRQRRNGWGDFGLLTHNKIVVKKGWRAANFSDGIANHFDAISIKKLVTDCTPKTAIGRLSSRLSKLMSQEKGYKDNCSIAIVDF